jgi:hypothetical protein
MHGLTNRQTIQVIVIIFIWIAEAYAVHRFTHPK